MAHQLEVIDGNAQMAYRASAGVPWHGLGYPVEDNLTPAQMMRVAHLDWTVSKKDTYIKVPRGNTEVLVPTGTQALVRDSDHKILTQVGEKWEPVQNAEAFDFFREFVEAGNMVMDTAGSLKGGEIVWALADIRDGFTIFGGDEVKGYLLFSNPHQYGKAVNVQYCMIRVVCNNTLTMAFNEKGALGVKINHRAKFNPEEVKKVLGLSHNRLEDFKEKAEFLGTKKYDRKILEKYFGSVFGYNEETARLSRTADKLMGIVEKQPGIEFAPGTMWQAFNAVTYTVDHLLGREADSRLTTAWFGSNAKKKLEALDAAVAMAKAM